MTNTTNAARDLRTGKYAHSDFAALCVCGHPLGEHTADVVGGLRPCLHGDFHAEGCGCERFRKARR